MTLCSECKTFGLAVQIVEPPSIKEPSRAATSRKIVEPRNRRGLVTEQIETTIRTYFEVAEVGAGFGQRFIGKPARESDEPMTPLINRPPLAIGQCAATD
jgi:hypothetical protein